MELKVYADRKSQPSRAVIIFCKVNGIDFEEIEVDLAKKQHLSSEFKEVNPMRQVPAIAHGSFKLFESNAILEYLASAFPSVADHWYPTNLQKRSQIHSVLDWHHSNLCQSIVGYVLNTTLGPFIGLPLNPQAAAQSEKLLYSSLSNIESIWLNDGAKFLLGVTQPSIADLRLVCEIMQLEVLDESDRNRFLGQHKKVQAWVENTRTATSPYFDEVHGTILNVRKTIEKQRLSAEEGNREAVVTM